MQTRIRPDNLTEEALSEAEIEGLVIGFIIYGAEGLIMTITNFPVVFAIFIYKKLRVQKEYIFVAGLAFADGLYGFGFLVAAFGRIAMIRGGNGFVLISRWECSLKIWNIIWLISNPMAGAMLLVISIDRLLAVSKPLRYFSYTNRYAFKLVGAVFIYIMLPALKVQHDIAMLDPEKMARLKRITMTVGISVFFTFIFNMIPDLLLLTIDFPNPTPVFILLNGNAIVNMITFTYRYKDIRQGLKSLILCRCAVISSTINPQRQIPVERTSQPGVQWNAHQIRLESTDGF